MVVVVVVADEIDDHDAVLVRELAQSAAKLLGEYDAGLCAAQHHDLVDGGDIDALVEHVDGEQVVEFAVGELPDVFVAFFLR